MQSPRVPPPYPRIRDIPAQGTQRRTLLRSFNLVVDESDFAADGFDGTGSGRGQPQDVALQQDSDGNEPGTR